MQLDFDRHRSTGYMVNWAARLMAKAIDEVLAPHGLSSGYMPVFFALAAGGTLTQRDLAALAQVEQPTMAATLSRMQRDGLIERRANPADGRSALVSLSATGHEKLAAVHEAVMEINGAATQGFTEPERDELLVLLGRVVGNLVKD